VVDALPGYFLCKRALVLSSHLSSNARSAMGMHFAVMLHRIMKPENIVSLSFVLGAISGIGIFVWIAFIRFLA
jgi:hypothetical protein